VLQPASQFGGKGELSVIPPSIARLPRKWFHGRFGPTAQNGMNKLALMALIKSLLLAN
jgi:hypothetical protein